jgi:hypothetical protein
MVKFILAIIFSFVNYISFSQVISSDEIQLMDTQRINSMINSVDKSNSFSYFIRSSKNYYDNTVIEKTKKPFIRNIFFSYDNQNNSTLPLSFNDGNFFPARGWQERYSLGVNFRYKFIEINYQPEKVVAQNKPQDFFVGDIGNYWARYYQLVRNNIDDFRSVGFGNKIDTTTLGQSYISLNFGKISIGTSNQNIWWGPGLRNSLIFTNTAAGFQHIFLNSNKPIVTPLGKIEFSGILGRIDSTRFEDPDDPYMRTMWEGGMIKKKNITRTISAFTINFQPKYLKNLFIGYAFSRQFYKKDFNQYNQAYSYYSKDKPKMDLGVLMFRFSLPRNHAEIYAELGQPEKSPWPWKFFGDSVRTGFVVGIRKFVPLRNNNFIFEFSTEFTQLALMNPRLIFNADPRGDGPQFNSWYTSPIIRHGYSNDGQLLGSNIGPGSTSQMIGVGLRYKKNRIGIKAEKIVYNYDFYYFNYLSNVIGSGWFDRLWIDLNRSIDIQVFLFNNILLSANYMLTDSWNYRWYRRDDNNYYLRSSPDDKYNTRINFSIKYNLK